MQVTFKGSAIKLAGKFPQVGEFVENFKLVKPDLQDLDLKDFIGQTVVLNIFPSIDTPVCSSSVIQFNKQAGSLSNAKILCISKDLPFAQARFCGAENINNVLTLSAFRNLEIDRQLGVGINDGPLKGLLARAVIVLNKDLQVTYTQLVPEITDAPNYDQCLEAIWAIQN